MAVALCLPASDEVLWTASEGWAAEGQCGSAPHAACLSCQSFRERGCWLPVPRPPHPPPQAGSGDV